MTKTVFVVMGNDYPDAVFTTWRAAEDYCEKRRKEDPQQIKRIYWRVYEFTLQD